MNTNEHEAPDRNRQTSEPDLGPEPDWLVDEAETTAPGVMDEPELAAPPAYDVMADSDVDDQPADDVTDGPRVEVTPTRGTSAAPDIVIAPAHGAEAEAGATTVYHATGLPIQGQPVTIGSRTRSTKPWLWWAVPLALTAVLAALALWASSRGLNDFTTWTNLRSQDPGLLPARWTMLMWWIVLALLAGFLIYSALPRGRAITRINRTGPLIAAAVISAGIWIIAVHWRWEAVALVAMVITLGALLASYLMVSLNPAITHAWQRVFGVMPLSAAVAFSTLLLVLSWQNYSSQPFGNRGTSMLLLLLLVIVAAVFAFFVRDGVISLVFTIWFLGVAQQQWGEDTLISVLAIVALLLTATTAAMGFILAVESHRPSLTAQITDQGGRVKFFRKPGNSPTSDLPQ